MSEPTAGDLLRDGKLTDALTAAQNAVRKAFTAVSLEAYLVARLEAGIPLHGVDFTAKTMPPELGESVRQAAARQGTSVSTWLTDAAADKLRNELLGAALDQWEAEDGPFTQAELDEAASRLGLAPRSDVA